MCPRPSPPPPDPGQAATRALLLEAAGEVFAEVGFRAATVRAICQRAGVNIAAVNYHFGDKERLYVEVLRHSHEKALAQYPMDLGAPAGATPEERLRAFVRSFLLRMLASGPMAWHGKLLALEMIEPTQALDALVQERFRPMARLLRQIIRSLLGPAAGPEVERLCGCSIVSQCLFYQHCRSVVARMFPDQQFGPADLERLADHITRFSLAALRAFAAEGSGRDRRRRKRAAKKR
jgi:AcrR family transcriptional regulator